MTELDETFIKDMFETVEQYEKTHGEIDERTMKVMYVNKDDAMVWDMLPLTDIQKKFIFVKLYSFVEQPTVKIESPILEEPLEILSQSSEI
jgi:hypothetical protein